MLINLDLYNNPEDKPIIWTLEQAIEFVRNLEVITIQYGAHIALTGGVLYKGTSTKDIDVIVYPHNTEQGVERQRLIEALDQLGISAWTQLRHEHYRDSKEVWEASWQGKRIDFFFLLC